MSMARRLLQTGVAELGVPYGRERSCKLAAGKVLGDRFLLSVHRDGLGAEPLKQILALLGPVGVPDGLAKALEQEFAGADVVHFGYEAADDTEICKVYFEHVENMRRTVKAPQRSGQPVLVHRAWKWRLPATKGFTLTDYTWRPNAPGEGISERIAELCDPPGAGHVGARAVRTIRALTGDKVRFDDLMLLEVREEGTVRHSFDLNLYPADLTVRGIVQVIEQLRDELELSPEQLSSVFDPVADMTVGHISGGSGRDTKPFVTIYFGVEAC
jgi:tryptophan halogenase